MAASVASRRQSARQIRTSTTRPLNYYTRTFDGRAAHQGDARATTNNPQPGFFPAITHFTDAADAFPQEMIRHFSMLKEVDAKVHQPDEELRRLSDAISRLPAPPKPNIPTHEGHFPGLSGRNSLGASRNGSVISLFTPMQAQAPPAQPAPGQATPNDLQLELERQQLFRQLNYTIIHLASMLDEKMAVLVTANQIVGKQLDRMESSYKYVGEEVSDEARFGSVRHWAYVTEKETKKPPERARRENAGTNHFAAAADDFASIRSEARREAMQAKRARKQQIDSDFDDVPPSRKGAKGRKPAVENADGRSVGLGITNGAPVPGKKRKAPGGAAMERSISAVMRGALNKSPRETPLAEPGKKRAKAAPGAAPRRRNQPAGGASPHPASSPLVGTFAQREVGSRPTTARARQNSNANTAPAAAEPPKNLPSSISTNQPHNGVPTATQQITVAVDNGVSNQLNDEISVKEPADSVAEKPVEPLKLEEADQNQSADVADAEPTAPTVITTRAGRASKPATPIIGTFPEIPLARVRSARNKDPGGGSHASSESGYGDRPTRKKRGNGASTPSLLAEAPARKQSKSNGDGGRDSTAPDDERSENAEAPADGEEDADEDMDVDENEPRYCYCNGVSYGEMIACDNENCPRGEWFHLKCVGLKEAPPEGEWYCDTCRETLEKKRRR